MARLIADTNLLIDLERGKAIPLVDDNDEIVISAITASELIAGVALSAPDRQQKRAEFVEQVLAELPIIDFNQTVARVHGKLYAAMRKAGTPHGAYDLMIAATAIAEDRPLLTRDTGFAGIPDLRLMLCN